MSIFSEISRIAQNVSDSLDAVAAKGVTVPSGSTSDDLPDLIAQITGGGNGGIVIHDTIDSAGGTIRTITAVAYVEGDDLEYGGSDRTSPIVGVGQVGYMVI